MSDRVRYDGDRRAVVGERILRESGNSVVLTIPPEVYSQAGFELGDEMEVLASMDREEGEAGEIRIVKKD